MYTYADLYIYITNIYIKGVYQASSELKDKGLGTGEERNGCSAWLAGLGQSGSGQISRVTSGFREWQSAIDRLVFFFPSCENFFLCLIKSGSVHFVFNHWLHRCLGPCNFLITADFVVV